MVPDAEEVLPTRVGSGARTRSRARAFLQHARPEGVPEDDLTIWAMKPEELSAYDWTGEGMTVEIARAGILDKVVLFTDYLDKVKRPRGKTKSMG